MDLQSSGEMEADQLDRHLIVDGDTGATRRVKFNMKGKEVYESGPASDKKVWQQASCRLL